MSNKRVRVILIGFLLMAVVLGVSGSVSAAYTGGTTLISRHTNGAQGNADSNSPTISADGRYVAFFSTADNLVSGDTNARGDVFVYDRQTGQTTIASLHDNGTQGGGSRPSISADGRYVAFQSSIALVDDDVNGVVDIYVHDRTTGQTSRVSLRSDGAEADDHSTEPAISGDGRFVAFVSEATNLIDSDANGTVDIFVHDRQTGQTALVTRHTNGTQADTPSTSESPTISGDGRYIAFSSTANTLTDGDMYHVNDIFVHDRITSQTTMISRGPDIPVGYHYAPSISADGRYVAFQASGVSDDCGDRIFRYDRQTEMVELASWSHFGGLICLDTTDPAISADGRYVAFVRINCMGGIWCEGGWNYQILQRDMQLDQTVLISVTPSGSEFGNDDALEPAVSGDGQFVAYSSVATDVVAGDINGLKDVFLRENPYTISGTLRDENGNPIVGVYVRLDNSYDSYATSDVNGNYTLGRVSPGQHAVTVSSNHYSFATGTRQVTVPPHATGIDFTGVNTRPHTISGTIRDGNGDPLSYISIYFYDSESNHIDYLDTGTGEDGTYSVDVAPGQYTVRPSADEYNFPTAPLSVTVPPNATEVDFTGFPTTAYTFIATEDAYVSQSAPEQNFGADTVLGVRDNASGDLTTYIKFDVNGLGPCDEVIYGVLELWGGYEGFDGGTLHKVGNAWTEGGITWNNAPAISGTPDGYMGPVDGTVTAPVTSLVTGNGIYSFAIKGRTSNTVWYDSTESSTEPSVPFLWLSVQSGLEGIPPTAAFSAAPPSGRAPLVVNFTDQSTGCAESWAWDFGDGGTSTQQNPSHIYTTPGTYTVSLTASNGNGSDGETKSAYVTVNAPPPPSPSLYASPLTAGTVGGVAVTPQDILFRNGTAGTWAMHFDGSDVGVTKALTAFAHLPGGDLLLVFKANQPTPAGTFTPWDVARFTPTSLGSTTAGTFAWYIDGSDVALTTTAEKIDALDVLSDDRVLISTAGTLAVPKPGGGTLKSQDEDLTALTPTTLGATTAGTWALYFNGTAVTGFGVEDLVGAHVDEITGDIYVAVLGAFKIGGISGSGKDILKMQPSGGGHAVTLHWRGPQHGFNLNLGGIESN